MNEDGKLTYFDVDEAMKPVVSRLAVGDDEQLEAQLIEKSRQANIVQHTPKDAKERFGDMAMFKAWKAKGKEIHWLLADNGDLAGIIWYGKSEPSVEIDVPEVPLETFAIRIYDGYAGHGLARPFMTLSLRVLVEQKKARGEAITPIWLQTDLDNPAAIAAYTKFGYEEIARDDARATMILSTEKIKALVEG